MVAISLGNRLRHSLRGAISMGDVTKQDEIHYKKLLKKYIENHDENYLYKAEQVSKIFLQKNFLPEEIVNLHNQTLKELYPDQFRELKHSMNFLLETMISYGLAHQEFQTLREEQLKLKSEISVAANVQKTLLATTIPHIPYLDIGAISVPAEQMNGDYYHFSEGKEGSLGIAIADVIGKGVPAALCMSMIKYAMDGFPELSMRPQAILKGINRIVERDVDPSIFITMFYAQYHPKTAMFQYASAGHEPGFHYDATEDTFSEIQTKGLVLGALPHTTYEQYEFQIGKGDMIILLTDGVTECRREERFIEVEEVLAEIRKYKGLPAQEIVHQVYKYFERLQNFQLKDDFTLIVIKKED